ncbi:uncharacterized protein LOC100123099 [Nasonia vitripennis]|uniref:Farnesoic acid O-methyl transferase domain-containing protein n=1 Tax=Nasonia vitripennis TaxID=7425 RepID=A0A7M7G815_NASVI|nr:uncharacterized protein LOC100123099 [Nasonia vitripennis]
MSIKVPTLLFGVLAAAQCLNAAGNDIKTVYTYGYAYSQFFPLEENLSPDRVLRFSVRAPRDAHILLAPTHEADQPVYEIVLGARNNTMNHIRGRCPCQEEPSASVRTVNLLSRREFRNFWVKVASDRLKTAVQVGLGESDTPFHEWRDPRPLAPMFLSFRSATPATWHYGFRDEHYENGVSSDRRQTVVTSTGFGQYFPLSDHVSHSEDGITLYFTARTSRELQILLSPEVSTLGDVYLIGIRANGAYVRRRYLGDNSAAFQQPGFLNGREKIKFWIKLTRDGVIMLGKGGSPNPVLQWRDPTSISPQYLSFLMYRETDEDPEPSLYADVQYGLGPDYTISSQDCTARWKGASSQLPPGAVRGGRLEDGEIFVCRANHDGDTIPGSYIIDENLEGKCYISYNFSVIRKTQFEVLTGCRLKWVSASLGHVPEGSIVGGYQRGRPKYYVARVKHEGLLLMGKLQPDLRLAHVPYSGQELPFTNYETLVQLAPTGGSVFFHGKVDVPSVQESPAATDSSVSVSVSSSSSSSSNEQSRRHEPHRERHDYDRYEA